LPSASVTQALSPLAAPLITILAGVANSQLLFVPEEDQPAGPLSKSSKCKVSIAGGIVEAGSVIVAEAVPVQPLLPVTVTV